MEFFNSAVGVLQTLVVALGAGLGIWGVMGFWKHLSVSFRAANRGGSLCFGRLPWNLIT